MKFETIDQLAIHCLDNNEGSIKARAAMVAAVSRSQRLKALLLTRGELERICGSVLYGLMRRERRELWTETFDSPNPDASVVSGSLQKLSKKLLYDYPLFDGTKLGDAKREKIAEQRQINESHARSNATRARWFGLIEAQLKTKTVRETLTNDQLEHMKEKASGE